MSQKCHFDANVISNIIINMNTIAMRSTFL